MSSQDIEVKKKATEIANWLRNPIDIRKINEKHWQIDLAHNESQYTLTVIDHGDTVSFGAELIPDIVGKNVKKFYREILEYNAIYNYVSIGIDGERIVLTMDSVVADMNQNTIFRNLSIFHSAHEELYSSILDRADKNNLAVK